MVIILAIFSSLVKIVKLLNVLRHIDYSLISFTIVTDEIRPIIKGRLPLSQRCNYETFLLDERLKAVASINEAAYFNIRVEGGEPYRFRIAANTFMLKSQEEGILFLIASADSQACIEKYELTSRIDSLTQLPNRTELAEVIDEISGSFTPFLMCTIDLDHFKQVNDNFGHLFGDLVLKHSANYLSENIKIKGLDRIIRLGGEEFLLLFQCSTASYDEFSVSIARRVLSFNHENISFSGGIVKWEPVEMSFDNAFKQCDNLLYKAKEGGRRQIRIINSENEEIKVCENYEKSKVCELDSKNKIANEINTYWVLMKINRR